MNATAQRFIDKVLIGDDCWQWQGATATRTKRHLSYGMFRYYGKPTNAHRVSFRLFRGPIPYGKQILHHCDNPGCVKPSHLYVGTHSDNMRDKRERGRCRPPVGEQQHNHKLTSGQVLEIRKLCAEGEMTQWDIAHLFGVRQACISAIHTRRSWKHLP